MAAYFIALQLKPKCNHCHGRASVEVFNRFNASCGVYCKPCAKKLVRKLDAGGKQS